MDKPPLYFKLWIWLLDRANFKDRDMLRRGQLVATIAEMQVAMSFYTGYRKITPTRDEIRSAFGYFTKAAMVTSTKTTRGMVITISNYELYQNPKNYGPHRGNPAEPTVTPHDTEEGEKGRQRSIENLRPKANESPSAATLFGQFWKGYPNKKAKALAEKAWLKINPDGVLFSRILAALVQQKTSESWQQDGGRFIPYPATWLNGRRWEDVLETRIESQVDELVELRAKGVIV